MTAAPDTFPDSYTDQADTVATDLALIQEEISALVTGDTAATLEHIETQLGGLYQQAEQSGDTTAQQAITDTWQQAQQLAQNSDLLLGAAVSVTHTLRNVEKSHEKLVTDLENLDQDNPLVFNMVELVTEDVFEDLDEKLEDVREETIQETEDIAYLDARQIIFDEIVIELENICHVNNFTARQFAQVIMGGSCPDRLQETFFYIGDHIEREIELALERGDILS